MSHKLIPGSVLELCTNANCIPAGLYRFEAEDDEFLLFSVGSRIVFGLCKGFYEPFLKPVRSHGERKTSTESFLSQYATLFRSSGTFRSGIQGITFCFMHPAVQRRFLQIRRSKRLTANAQTHP